MTGTKKRVKDLTDADIDAFTKKEIESWMNRIMRRLYEASDPSVYKKMARKLIRAARQNIDEIKRFLKQAIDSMRPQPVQPVLYKP